MASFLGNKMKDSVNLNDQVIANNSIAAAKGAANAYLNATLNCSTPELKAMLATSLSQVVEGHAALAEISNKHGWDTPYDTPINQLSSAYKESKTVVRD